MRFARADNAGGLHQVIAYGGTTDSPANPSDATAPFRTLLKAYLGATGGAAGCTGAAIGAAGPVEGDAVTLTNRSNWTIRSDEVSGLLAGAPVKLLNDLQAVAAALPHLQTSDLEVIGKARPDLPGEIRDAKAPMLALNVGTGFGAALAVCRDGVWFSLPSEAGHMTLAASVTEKQDLLDTGPSVESLLSGAGVAALYDHLAVGRNTTTEPDGAAEIFARSANDPHAAAAVGIFSDVLGRIAGDLVLATGAWGGVYLTGSVTHGWAACADLTRFRNAFTSKGLMRERMTCVPTAIITRAEVALFGLAMVDL